MKFTKHNNPNKKRKIRRKSYTDACIDTVGDILYNKRNGIDLPDEYYNELAKSRSERG